MARTVAVLKSASDWRQTVVEATVRLPRKGGQGVRVQGGYVLTAAHCVDWHTGGMMTLDDSYERVETRTNQRLLMRVEAVEPVADIAVLGAGDNQTLGDDADAFEEFCAETAALNIADLKSPPPERFKPLTMAALKSRGPFKVPKPPRRTIERVHVLTHKGTWIEASASVNARGVLGPCTWLQAKQKIEGGTSGGPIVNERGELLGVVSHCCEQDLGNGYDGAFPSPPRALPGWLWRRIQGK